MNVKRFSLGALLPAFAAGGLVGTIKVVLLLMLPAAVGDVPVPLGAAGAVLPVLPLIQKVIRLAT